MSDLYFGKLGKDTNPKQFKQGFVQASEEWMSGIQVNDYAFVLCNGKIALWKNKSKKAYNSEYRWDFDIIDSDIGYDTKKFRNLIGLLVGPSMVLIQRQSKFGFFKINLQSGFKVQTFINKSHYAGNNFRKINLFYAENQNQVYPKDDINLLYTNDELKLLPSSFIDNKIIGNFLDRRNKANGSRKNKDKVFKIVNDALKNKASFLSVDELYVADFYDAFFCEYDNKQVDNDFSEFSLNQILFGPPGTGKTYVTKELAVQICDSEYFNSLNKEDEKYRELITEKYRILKEEKRIVFTTFHQSMSYEDFIEGIKPVTKDENGVELNTMKYKVLPGMFKRICETARKSSETKLPYLLIIDEINRGNIPQIFGELITLIEETKRDGAEDEQSCVLPYSQSKFSVPQNLYILGTMNTADRSVEALDTALRRRFSFIPMMPDSTLLSTDIEGINVKELLETINKRIEYLLDRDHTIGHAYLINCVTRNDIVKVFKNKIIPQLQEYFYSDWKKIQLILGESIVKEREQNSVKEIFGIDMLDDYSDEKKSYCISENTEEWDFNLPVKLNNN